MDIFVIYSLLITLILSLSFWFSSSLQILQLS